MTSKEIRDKFLEYFKSKDHRIVESAPVVPFDDPTLLFTNAGMNQFKDVFLGKGNRDYNRAADTQKCIRVSGKHNDLEEVGHDTYHHTFFEMLGNWSFGDYYKEEAIEWAWELLTDVWKLPKERLWATVYRTDDEAMDIWKNKTDINPAHILKFDEKDNFWEMGDTGPCGPCSEIHINLSDDLEDASLVNAGVPECIEIWNLVFIQYYRDETGKLTELPAKHVDTGMGFERVCAVLQGKKSNYDSDVFMPLIQKIAETSGKEYEGEKNQIAMRVIADHIRTLTFAIADGAVPGNEGRGYVLRRILRRAARYGRNLGLTDPFMYNLVDHIVQTMSYVFPEIKSNRDNVVKIIKAEEESFNTTLDRGIELFDEIAKKTSEKQQKVIDGAEVFKLYDTFGFPVDLTAVMAKENGLDIDEAGFNKLMDEQKARARKSTKDKISGAYSGEDVLETLQLKTDEPTEFLGYDTLAVQAKVLSVAKNEKNTFVVFSQSPFYVEAGGQVSDKGYVTTDDFRWDVVDVLKKDSAVIHVLQNNGGDIKVGDILNVYVDPKRRWDIMRNHSVTHFLHKALRSVLGEHVKQSGSYVGPDRLRFDFTHFSKLSEEEITKIESIVNEKVRENLNLIHHRNIEFEQAKEMGALMFFGDKYGDKVNVVQFGDFTLEFCGGTHVTNSSQIGLFKILNESSIASGVRRIEAVTGAGVEKLIQEKDKNINEAKQAIADLNDEKKKLEKQLAELQLKEKLGGIDVVISSPSVVKEVNVYKGKVDAVDMNELKSMGDELRNKMKSGVGMLISAFEEKVGIVCVVSDDLVKDKKIMAGKIVGAAAKLVGGGGGGRPHMATAGGKDVTKIDEAIEKFDMIVEEMI
ncbi:MAG: alanine--tRNA ligase [Melioribacteraceae bacterium]|nr:MAG: alanine--tRNA ligase [Melioribacteraceae bacterium]